MATRDAAAAAAVSGGTAAAAANKIPERPRRPLTAYNLFYRYKRAKIREAKKRGDDSREAIVRTIKRLTGLEGHSWDAIVDMSRAEVNALCRAEIRSVLIENLTPRDTTRRSHKSQHGAMSFLELSRAMIDAWKEIDPFSREVFEGLAKEGRDEHKQRLAEYNARYPNAPRKKSKKKAYSSKAKSSQCKKPPASIASAGSNEATPKAAALQPSSFARVTPFGSLETDLDLYGYVETDLDLAMEPLPLFPNILDLAAPPTASTTNPTVSELGSSDSSDAEEQGETTARDFMALISSL
ncbi:hypothetical protein ACHAXT_006511 [Thalassiosira profunda]